MFLTLTFKNRDQNCRSIVTVLHYGLVDETCQRVWRQTENGEIKLVAALAGVAQWTRCWPVNQRLAGLIPSQGTCLGCGPGPQDGVHKRQPYIDVPLPIFLPYPLSKNK